MSWQLSRWVWLLESPLYIGTTPAGSLNRCRLYVPARAMWGAITAERARQGSEGFPDYERVGATVQKSIRFSYLYPAESDGRCWRAWLPRYVKGKGLVWRREDEIGELTAREMRMRLFSARACTAIDPHSESADEGSLRETECILPRWRDSGAPTALVGYVFVKLESSVFANLSTIFLGGDTRYGLGRLRRLEMRTASDLFGAGVSLDRDNPVILSKQLLAHTVPASNSATVVGSRELLVGWDREKGTLFHGICQRPLWVPGSIVSEGDAAEWHLDEQGIWRFGRTSKIRPG